MPLLMPSAAAAAYATLRRHFELPPPHADDAQRAAVTPLPPMLYDASRRYVSAMFSLYF